jgi:hypothetical protein
MNPKYFKIMLEERSKPIYFVVIHSEESCLSNTFWQQQAAEEAARKLSLAHVGKRVYVAEGVTKYFTRPTSKCLLK